MTPDISLPNRPRWDDHDWQKLSPLGGNAEAELCVVGLGGTGLTCITEALDLGVSSVIGIDAADVAAGAAGRNGGLLLAGTVDYHHDAVEKLGRDETLAITHKTMDEANRMAESLPPGLVRFPGSVRLAASDEEMEDCERQYEMMRRDGLAVERYNGPMGRGLLIPTDGVFQPMRRCRIMAERVQKRGARLYGDTPAMEIDSGKVITPNGTIRARHIIVCVDGKLNRLFPSLESEIKTARLQMLATAPTERVRFPYSANKRYGYDYWQQLPDGCILLGGGRDTTPDTEWTDDNTPSEAIQNYLTNTLRNELGVDAEITHRWAASVSYTDTGLPVFRSMGDNIQVMGAYSGTGNLVGAVLGRAAAEVASKTVSS